MNDFLHTAWTVLSEAWLLILSVLVAWGMAMGRTLKANGKFDWVESVMCGFFALGIYYALSWLSLPEGVGVLFSAIVGYKGTTVVSHWISKKLGFEDTEGN